MAYKVIVMVVALATVVLGDIVPIVPYQPGSSHHHHHHHPHQHPHDPAKYDFHYTVTDKYNDFGHWESRDGDRTEGKYFVVLPDNRKQIVTYVVDDQSGYVAEVTYEGDPVYPKHIPYKPDPYPKHTTYKPDPYPKRTPYKSDY